MDCLTLGLVTRMNYEKLLDEELKRVQSQSWIPLAGAFALTAIIPFFVLQMPIGGFFKFVCVAFCIPIFVYLKNTIESQQRITLNGLRERYDLEIEEARVKQKELSLELVRQENRSANERALALSQARDNALAQILSADLQSKNELLLKISQKGTLRIQFSDGQNEDDQGAPSISWEWSPLQNAVIKIYRNEGSILEDVSAVMQNANLIHVEQHEPSGKYRDGEAAKGRTYNFYAFVETRRTGVRAEPITRDLPPEIRSGKIIDSHGNEVTAFNTVQPVTYEEPFYDGFCYRRITVGKWLDGREQRKESLAFRRGDLEMMEEEAELGKLEKEISLRSGNFDTHHIQLLIAEAKAVSNRGSVLDKAEKLLDAEEDLDDRQREIILAFIKKQSYR